jgi:hypothetical protein
MAEVPYRAAAIPESLWRAAAEVARARGILIIAAYLPIASQLGIGISCWYMNADSTKCFRNMLQTTA